MFCEHSALAASLSPSLRSGGGCVASLSLSLILLSSQVVSMGDLGHICPRLQQLKLNNSSVECIRDLGTDDCRTTLSYSLPHTVL